MKAIKCTIIINNRWGYCYTPKKCSSIRKAREYGKNFIGGFAYRIFTKNKKIIYGYCDND